MKSEAATVLEHRDFGGGYNLLVFDVPAVASEVVPGQFIHLRVPRLEGAVLRRPFSVFKADAQTLSVLYKQVGRGTRAMGEIAAGESVSIVGPLGNGFPQADASAFPVLVAGGYGVAPLYLLASRMPAKGILFVGGRSEIDILCVDAFLELGWEVQVTTEDGSIGSKGLVTGALDRWLSSRGPEVRPEFFACGPDGLLKAVGDRVISGNGQGWLSLDKHMGCGVGACLACVQKIRVDGGSVVWKRVCKDGPIFEAHEIVWPSEDSA
ncbi:MAG: dihydroorotate dehydrogenase electron transfer subunit [Verrucomicrobia bacterium]|nr:dihydroorotate dehydrogenase electron transfer subunit [Verrucomicrobiota bacterium]